MLAKINLPQQHWRRADEAIAATTTATITDYDASDSDKDTRTQAHKDNYNVNAIIKEKNQSWTSAPNAKQ